jgi:hypothetical protein
MEDVMKTWGRYNQFNMQTAKEAFLQKVEIDPSGCWLWAGATANCKRYGSVGIAGKSYLAHRAALLLLRGVDAGDLNVCHTCDNGFCVNPDHLFLGTQQDNVVDMEQKQRSNHPRGERHGRAKLSAQDAADIHTAHAAGESIRSITRRYPVSKPSIQRIVRGIGWTTK